MHSTYAAWSEQALLADARSGADRWKAMDQSDLYDHKVIRRRYDELVEVRATSDSKRLLYYLNEGLHGNMGDMGAPGLYTKAKFGTKTLITNYVEEVVAALNELEDIDERKVDFHDKLAYFKRAQLCFGRSALMLSGAGSYGPFHLGVIKALREVDLIPNVISGASAGSVVAAIVGTHNAEELSHILDSQHAPTTFELMTDTQGFSTSNRSVSAGELRNLIEAAIPDMTFIEAHEKTGRYVNVSVAPSQMHQRSRLLNAITSPNALIREAVLASCSIPGVFPPVTLAARDEEGKRTPYVPSRTWIDGSITNDLPAQRLSRMYGVNHFISSQANPMVRWALQDPNAEHNLAMQVQLIYQRAAREWIRASYPFVMQQLRDIYPLNMWARLLYSVATQEYTADITILPKNRIVDPSKLLAPLTNEETWKLVREGEQATWPKLEMIRNCTAISRTIEAVLSRLEARIGETSIKPKTRRRNAA